MADRSLRFPPVQRKKADLVVNRVFPCRRARQLSRNTLPESAVSSSTCRAEFSSPHETISESPFARTRLPTTTSCPTQNSPFPHHREKQSHQEEALSVADEFLVRARELQEGPGMPPADIDYMAAKVRHSAYNKVIYAGCHSCTYQHITDVRLLPTVALSPANWYLYCVGWSPKDAGSGFEKKIEEPFSWRLKISGFAC